VLVGVLRLLARDGIVHGVATEDDGVLGAGALHGCEEPQDRVVLLLHDGSVRRFDDIQRLLGHGDLTWWG
jgi:hypothetical protein